MCALHVMDEKQAEDLAMVRAAVARSFTATPSAIGPFEYAVLTWNVALPPASPPVRVALIGGGFNVR